MQQWEYRSVEFAWDEDTGRWDDDDERSGETLTEVLVQYGVEGWEMVGFAADRWMSVLARSDLIGANLAAGPWEVQVYRAVFKRPTTAK